MGTVDKRAAVIVAAGLLIASLFMQWYTGSSSFPTPASSGWNWDTPADWMPDARSGSALSAWQAFGWEDVLLLFVALTAVAASIVNLPITRRLASVAGCVGVAVCVWRALALPDAADSVSPGAGIGIASAIGVAVGTYLLPRQAERV